MLHITEGAWSGEVSHAKRSRGGVEIGRFSPRPLWKGRDWGTLLRTSARGVVKGPFFPCCLGDVFRGRFSRPASSRGVARGTVLSPPLRGRGGRLSRRASPRARGKSTFLCPRHWRAWLGELLPRPSVTEGCGYVTFLFRVSDGAWQGEFLAPPHQESWLGDLSRSASQRGRGSGTFLISRPGGWGAWFEDVPRCPFPRMRGWGVRLPIHLSRGAWSSCHSLRGPALLSPLHSPPQPQSPPRRPSEAADHGGNRRG